MTIRITEDTYERMNEEGGGFCLACEAEAYGVEPDAEEYDCEECGESQVYGVEQLMLIGKITIVGGE